MPVPVNLYCTIVELPPLPMRPRAARDRSDPALAEHLRGLCGWILAQAQGSVPTPAQAHAVEHAWRVHNHLVFEPGPAEEAAVARFALAANALVFMPDATLRDPSGAVVVGKNPRGDAPYPEQGHARRRRSREQLAAWGFATPEHLPPSPCEPEVALRPPSEVWARALGLAKVAVYAEGMHSGDPVDADELARAFPGAANTADEIAFLASKRAPTQEIARFAFRYESLFALQWVLGLVPELPFPGQICDAGSVVRCMIDAKGPPSSLRSVAEILDVLDIHYRLHWVAVDRRVRAQASGPIDEGIVYERRVALQWLIGLGGFDWDEIPTPT